MKKIILALLILFGMSGYSKNVDSYESKKVFDGLMDVVLTGKYEKYANDPKMSKILDMDSSFDEASSFKMLNLGKDFQYTVTDVKERNNKSELTLRVNYKTSDISENNFLILMMQVLGDMGIGLNNIDDIDNYDDEKYMEVMIRMKEKSKLESHTDTVKIKMKKENGLWDLDESADEEKLLEFMLAPYAGIIELSE